MAACAETVPKRPLTASTGTWTAHCPEYPAARSASGVRRRSVRSESGAMSSPSSEGVNIGRQRGSSPGSRSPSRPLCLKMPAVMSASPTAAAISTRKSSSPRQPVRRSTSQMISR